MGYITLFPLMFGLVGTDTKEFASIISVKLNSYYFIQRLCKMQVNYGQIMELDHYHFRIGFLVRVLIIGEDLFGLNFDSIFYLKD